MRRRRSVAPEPPGLSTANLEALNRLQSRLAVHETSGAPDPALPAAAQSPWTPTPPSTTASLGFRPSAPRTPRKTPQRPGSAASHTTAPTRAASPPRRPSRAPPKPKPEVAPSPRPPRKRSSPLRPWRPTTAPHRRKSKGPPPPPQEHVDAATYIQAIWRGSRCRAVVHAALRRRAARDALVAIWAAQLAADRNAVAAAETAFRDGVSREWERGWAAVVSAYEDGGRAHVEAIHAAVRDRVNRLLARISAARTAVAAERQVTTLATTAAHEATRQWRERSVSAVCAALRWRHSLLHTRRRQAQFARVHLPVALRRRRERAAATAIQRWARPRVARIAERRVARGEAARLHAVLVAAAGIAAAAIRWRVSCRLVATTTAQVREAAAVRIQSYWRGRCAAAAFPERLARWRVERRLASERAVLEAAATIQWGLRAARCLTAHRVFYATLVPMQLRGIEAYAATRVQAVWRRYTARHHRERWMASHEAKKAAAEETALHARWTSARLAAVLTLQATWRRHLARRQGAFRAALRGARAVLYRDTAARAWAATTVQRFRLVVAAVVERRRRAALRQRRVELRQWRHELRIGDTAERLAGDDLAVALSGLQAVGRGALARSALRRSPS